MQAIRTRYIPITNTKPLRIKASCERGALTISCERLSQLGGLTASARTEDLHRQAAVELCKSFAAEDSKIPGCPIETSPWLKPFISGEFRGDFYHVFDNSAD